MNQFTYFAPTKILFGKGRIKHIAQEIQQYGSRILLAYGGSSIKHNGIYDTLVKLLRKADIPFVELSGIQPNPRLKSVEKGVKLCHEHKLDFILAVGGGSTLDCAKAIAAGYYYEGSPWDFCIRKAAVQKALPLGTILTLSATGSEMNGGAVISNEATQEKRPVISDHLLPKFSILDPEYTYTVPAYQTAAGTVDIFSHVCEQYFSRAEGSYVTDRISEGLMKTCIKYGPIALKEPANYEARANLMWTGSLAINGLPSAGKSGDWATHMIEHEVSAVYDVTHGAGLAVLTPIWMRYVLNKENLWRFVEFGQNVWNIQDEDPQIIAEKAIDMTSEFFSKLNMPKTLKELDIDPSTFKKMAEKATLFGPVGTFVSLDKDSVLEILKKAY